MVIPNRHLYAMKTYYQLLFLFPLFALVLAEPLVAQNTKQEVEKSISRDEMPVNALTLINQFWNEQKKVDFYREFDGEKISYEAKLKWEGYQYSIEFDEQGLLEDVEQLIEFDQLPDALQNTITVKLEQQYSKFRINHVQRQFLPEGDDVKFLDQLFNENFQDLTIRYELEVDGQSKSEFGSFELLFDQNGQQIRKRKIVRRSLDNIW